jgi:hypothetical protein
MAEESSSSTPSTDGTSTVQQQQQQMQPPQPHGPVPEGLECLVTLEDIDETNYVEYQIRPRNTWRPAKMEETIVRQLLKSQFHEYIQRVKTTNCQAELKRLLTAGPPIYIADPHGLPLWDDDDDECGGDAEPTTTTTVVSHVGMLWFASTDTEVSAVLDGAVQGEEREMLWAELKKFIIVEGKEKGDDDDNGEEDEK